MPDIGEWPQLGNTHKDGGRFVGHDDGLVAPYYAAGTPPVSKLYQSSVTPTVRDVRIGDKLAVSFDGKHWWASWGGVTVGRLTWTLSTEDQKPWQETPVRYPRAGVLEVRRLLLDSEGGVVNCGGIVRSSTP